MNKIKKLLSVCILSFTPLFAACSSDFEEPFIEIEEKQTTKTDNAWKNQLDNVLRKQTRNSSDKLYLIGYNYHKEIASLADLDDGLDEILADTAHIAYQNYIDYDFEIYTIGDVKISEYDSIRTRIDFDLLRTHIYTAFRTPIEEGNKVHLIKLKWLYNGNVIYSIAIVTDEQGILFDTIGHLIVKKSEPIIETEVKSSKTLSRIKARNEGGTGTNSTDTIKIYRLTDSITNEYGYTVFSYSIRCESVFFKNGILASRSHDATPNAST